MFEATYLLFWRKSRSSLFVPPFIETSLVALLWCIFLLRKQQHASYPLFPLVRLLYNTFHRPDSVELQNSSCLMQPNGTHHALHRNLNAIVLHGTQNRKAHHQSTSTLWSFVNRTSLSERGLGQRESIYRRARTLTYVWLLKRAGDMMSMHFSKGRLLWRLVACRLDWRWAHANGAGDYSTRLPDVSAPQ